MKNRTLSLLLLGLISFAVATTTQAQAPEQARQFQINTTHTGSISVENLTPPLIQKWVVHFGHPISYPLIADGKVFVTVKNPLGHGTRLFALNATNGSTLWVRPLGGTFWWSAACYENGRVFALNWDGVLRAFDGATGNLIWSNQLPGQFAFDSAPTVHEGVIYTAGAGSGGTVYAVSADSGAVLWMAPVANGSMSSPVVTSEGVYVSYSCPNVYKLDPASGATIWEFSNGCSGGGGKTPVLYNERLYVRDFSHTIHDSNTGTIIGNFSAKNAPVFSGSRGFFLHEDGFEPLLEARDVNTHTVLWSFAGDGFLQSALLVVNDYVYVGSAMGKLYAVDAATGQKVWETTAGSSIPFVDEQNVSQPLTSFAAAEGVLVVPTSTTLVAYARDTVAPVVTAAANPSTAPKRPQPVTITISGSVTDAGSGVSSASFNVIDEYGVTQPSGPVTVQANGTYSFTLTLPATKQGSDKNGHLYTIRVTGVDQAGNSATATTTLTIN